MKPPPRRARAERVTVKEEPEQDSPASPPEEREVREPEVRKEVKKEKKEESREVKEKKEPKEKKEVKPLEAVCKQEEDLEKVCRGCCMCGVELTLAVLQNLLYLDMMGNAAGSLN